MHKDFEQALKSLDRLANTNPLRTLVKDIAEMGRRFGVPENEIIDRIAEKVAYLRMSRSEVANVLGINLPDQTDKAEEVAGDERGKVIPIRRHGSSQ